MNCPRLLRKKADRRQGEGGGGGGGGSVGTDISVIGHLSGAVTVSLVVPFRPVGLIPCLAWLPLS